MRYAGADNFTGRPVPGYAVADCWLREEAARALARVAVKAGRLALSLVVFDGYRPQQATDSFVRWVGDPADEIKKEAYYPTIDKGRLFADGYIGKKSFHSTGFAVDLGLRRQDGRGLDFGTPFDLFDPRSATAHPAIGEEAAANRLLLVELMAAEGFENYPREWWHFRLRGFDDAPAYDLPILRL